MSDSGFAPSIGQIKNIIDRQLEKEKNMILERKLLFNSKESTERLEQGAKTKYIEKGDG